MNVGSNVRSFLHLLEIEMIKAVVKQKEKITEKSNVGLLHTNIVQEISSCSEKFYKIRYLANKTKIQFVKFTQGMSVERKLS